jgi:hypothetical protein
LTTEASTGALGDYRWTLNEYVLRCETGVDIRELVAEGEVDRDVLTDALARWKLDDVTVLDADYLFIAPEEVDSAGFSRGVKGALMTVASALDARSSEAPVEATVLIVVDRDFDGAAATEHLAVTDGYSLESYACSSAALERLIRLYLGRAEPPPGSRGHRPRRRTTCSGADLVSRVEEPAVRIAAVRLVLRELDPTPGVFDGWPDYVRVDRDGRLTADDESLLQNVLLSAGQGERFEHLADHLHDVRRTVAADPFLLVRGRDFVCLLLKLLRSRWGRRIAGNTPRLMNESRFARLMLLAVPPSELDACPLFQRVRATFS